MKCREIFYSLPSKLAHLLAYSVLSPLYLSVLFNSIVSGAVGPYTLDDCLFLKDWTYENILQHIRTSTWKHSVLAATASASASAVDDVKNTIATKSSGFYTQQNNADMDVDTSSAERLNNFSEALSHTSCDFGDGSMCSDTRPHRS